jgi:hypothetical protein
MDYSTLVYLGQLSISTAVLITVFSLFFKKSYQTTKEFIQQSKPLYAFASVLLIAGSLLASPSIRPTNLEQYYNYTVGTNNQTLIVEPKSNAPWYISKDKKAYTIVSITYKEYKVMDAKTNNLIVIPRKG